MFTEQQMQQLEQLMDRKLDEKLDNRLYYHLNRQHSEIIVDVKILLRPLEENIAYLKNRMDQFFIMESEDVQAVNGEVQELKTKVNKLDHRISALEA
jgi:hypothetical protein